MANLLAQPRKWDRKAIYITDESGGYGVDAAPTGLLNFVEARNVTLTSFEAETVDRNIVMPHMGNGGKIITSIWSKLSFEIALTGAGAAGTAPKYAFLLLGLAFSETLDAGTSATYNVVSENFDSLSAYINIDGTLHKLLGCRGEAKFALSAKGLPILKIELTSLYTAPAAAGMPAVDKTGWLIEEAVNAVKTGPLTVNGVDLAFSSFEWSCGNKIARIDLPGPQREVAITNRAPTASATVLAPALGVFNPYALAEANTPVLVSNTHGSAAGKKVKTDLKATISGVSEDQVEGMLAYKLSFSLDPVVGNDEITLTIL
ncbi:phage tail tube protein [Azonexus sp.]|uniref:phage tail tube protein n=1 Tax=Azonexus sp. TaxID=1872668 RepID=UPI0027B9183D|nr:phage tail tube protein [Azonexus sp.]